MATNVHLTPELERFARDCVEGGRYNNVSEVVRSALRLLQETEQRRLQFQAMLRETEAEAERDGTVALDDVIAEIDEIIAQHRKK
jgi:antitoxin ParD1/3/4